MYLHDLMLFISSEENFSKNVRTSGRKSITNCLPAGRQASPFRIQNPADHLTRCTISKPTYELSIDKTFSILPGQINQVQTNANSCYRHGTVNDVTFFNNYVIPHLFISLILKVLVPKY